MLLVKDLKLNPEFFNKIGLVITCEMLKETMEGFLIAGRRGWEWIKKQEKSKLGLDLGSLMAILLKKFLNLSLV